MIFALHGLLGCGADFDPLGRGLDPQFSLYSPDLPGHGSRGNEREITLDSTISYLRACHARNAPSARVLLGYSMGGRIALNWAVKEPNRFDALILISTSPGIRDPQEREKRLLSDQTWIESLKAIERSAWLKLWEQQPVFKTPAPISKSVGSQVDKQRMLADPDGWIAAMQGLGNGVIPFLENPLQHCNLPCLLISGEADRKFQKIHTNLAKSPAVNNVIIEQSGHRPHLEQPLKTALMINKFLETLEPLKKRSS
ncbi:MAG: alpha/beta fold hydrolase [Verrucomicrobiota bacterium]